MSKLNLTLLSSIAAATVANSYLFVSAADAAPFVSNDPPLVEQNEAMKEDGTGNLATRTTAEGTAYSAANPAPKPEAAADKSKTPKVKPTFALGTTQVVVPEIKRGGGVGTSTYPFDDLAVAGDGSGKTNCFFVPATADRPDPAKALASTVSSATRRHAVPEVDSEGKAVMEATKARPAKAAVGVEGQPGYEPAKEAVPAGTRQKMKQTRKFVVRAEPDGKDFGFPGVAGALIIRTQ